jgi:hypothetical protein
MQSFVQRPITVKTSVLVFIVGQLKLLAHDKELSGNIDAYFETSE